VTGPAKSEDGGCRQAFDKGPGGEMSPGRSGTFYAFPGNYGARLMLGFSFYILILLLRFNI
jgi:hypothetical protein